jgi:beta-lactamase regulating signal transducer with metallopeptidase domain
MNTFDASRWLWDFYSWATVLLAVAVVANFSIAQPARRMVIAWSTAWALLALALLTAVPNWSQYSLVASQTPKQVEAPEPQIAPNSPPDFEQQSQQPQQQIAFPPPNMAAVEAAPPNVVTIDWSGLSMTTLVMGSSLVMCWLALGAWQVRRLCASASPAPTEINRLLAELSQGKLPASQLGISQNLPVAVAVGLSKPWILLPQTLTHADRGQACSVLAHELAHVANRDLWLLAILRLLSVLLWPHPLFWLLRRQVRLDQELLADAAAAELTSRGSYAEQLVALARSAVDARVPRLASSVGLWERPSQLTKRIALLLDDKLTILRNCSRSWRIGSAGMLAILALALSLLTLAPKVAQSRAESEVTIIEETRIVSPEKFVELVKQSETTEGFADAVGDLIAAAIRPSQLPFISEKRLESIRRKFVNFVVQHTPADISTERKAELLAGLRDHARQHLELPDKPFTRHNDLNNVYLSIRDRDKTLKWELWMALTRKSLDDAEIARLEWQRTWMRETIKDQPMHPQFMHEKILADLDRKFADPLCVIFDRPMTEEAFAKFQLEIESWLAQKPEPNSTQTAYLDEELGLFRPLTSQLPYMVHHLLIEALYAQYRGERGQFRYPQFDNDEINGYGASGSYVTLHFASSKPQQGNMLSLESIETRGGAIDADKGFFADPNSTDQGDLAYQSHNRQLMALNDAKLLQLDALNWIEADAVTTDELKRKLQEVGKDQVSLPAFKARQRDQFIEDYQQGRVDWPFKGAQNLDEALSLWEAIGAGEGPYVAILTKNGNLAVVQVQYVSGERNPDSIDVRTRVRPKPVTDETVGAINAQAGAVAQVVAKPIDVRQSLDTARSQVKPNTVVGFCFDENYRPLAGVGVQAFVGRSHRNERPSSAHRTTTNADGMFQFDDLVDIAKQFPNEIPEEFMVTRDPLVVTIVARQQGRVPGIGNDTATRVAKSGISMPLSMSASHTLSGFVFDEGGKPIQGARVSTGHWANVPGIPADINAAKTNAEGRFEITDLEAFDAEKARLDFESRQRNGDQFLSVVNDAIGRPWERSILVIHPNFAQRRVIYSSIPGAVSAILEPGATVSGKVFTQEIDKDPQPAVNFNVVLERHPEEGKADSFGHQFHRVTSNEQGELRFESLPPGTYSMGANAKGWVTRGIDDIKVSKGQQLVAPDLVMTRGGKVRVKLVDSKTGKPLAFSKTEMGYIVPVPRPEAKRFWYPETMVQFTPDGHGELQLPPRRYSFMVTVLNDQGEYSWDSSDFENIADAKDLERIPAYSIVEGETLEIDVPMIRPEQIPQAALVPSTLHLKADVETDEEPKPTGTLFSN